MLSKPKKITNQKPTGGRAIKNLFYLQAKTKIQGVWCIFTFTFTFYSEKAKQLSPRKINYKLLIKSSIKRPVKNKNKNFFKNSNF
jgi:hypothetical protein